MGGVLLFVVIVFLLIAGVLGTRFVIFMSDRLENLDDIDSGSIRYQFRVIDDMIGEDTGDSRRLAVIEAGKLMDYVLKRIGVKGDSYYERLTAERGLVKGVDVERIYEVNRGVFEGVIGVGDLEKEDVRLVVEGYRSILQRLKLI